MKMHKLKMGIVFLAIVAGLSLAVMLLWNALLPTILGIAIINYWQALGLLLLARILFGGFGGARHLGHHAHHHGFDKNVLREKWMNMTDEERKEFLKKRHFHAHPFFGNDCKCAEEPKSE